ncbi:DUF1317 family protein [Arsukibacterium indicum]|uniref:DUF1317 family protein n=1 Tax=Arsukibacterium indicum TaxID=2848612 RepID=A0ABS6MHA8_9GAMM|nr:DUF1317 family protein [Arsukibacterium indicum]MBV2128196.1 DUF1317 family protein [Arsukibacterium indicum]
MSKTKYRYDRTAKPAEQSVFGQDITVGLATVKADTRRTVRGWALPGCKFTTCPFTAKAVAERMNQYIQDHGGLPKWSAKHVEVAA